MDQSSKSHPLDALLDHLLDRLAEKVAARLSSGNGHAPEEPDTLLTATEVAQRLGVKTRWLYARKLPFVVRLPNSRALRFSARGLERWIERRR